MLRYFEVGAAGATAWVVGLLVGTLLASLAVVLARWHLGGREYPHWHWSNENVRRDGLDESGEYQRGPRGVPYHGRAWFHLTPALSLTLEWHLWSNKCGVGFTRGDEGLHFSAGLPPCALYLAVEHRALATMRCGQERELSLRVFDWSLWWNLWTSPHDWSSSTPRWRNGCWHVLDALLGKVRVTERLLGPQEPIDVPMPERTYRGLAELREMTLKRPRWFARHVVRAELKMLEGEQVPIPGKGESGWDCGEDATYGVSMGDVRSIEEAVGRWVASTLETRRQRGGRNWRPEGAGAKFALKIEIEDGATEKLVEALRRIREGGTEGAA